MFLLCSCVFDHTIKKQLEKTRQAGLNLCDLNSVEHLALIEAHLHLPDYSQCKGSEKLQGRVPHRPRGGVKVAEADLGNVRNLGVKVLRNYCVLQKAS